MSSYSIAVLSLIGALLTQSIAAGLSIELYLRRNLPSAVSRTWLAIAMASLLLALHHGYTLELAMRTGLYDMRQAVLVALTGLFFALGIYGLRRQQV